MPSDGKPIDPGVDIGHVHLRVADVDRALDFYCGVLGFELTQRYGADAAFVAAGGYHHHLGLNSWESKGGSPPPAGSTGLYHVALRYPTRQALADAVRRLIEAGVPLQGTADHGVSEAIYLADPDGNGIELCWDRPREQWPEPRPGQKVEMFVQPLDLDGLLAEPPLRWGAGWSGVARENGNSAARVGWWSWRSRSRAGTAGSACGWGRCWPPASTPSSA